MTTHLHLHHLDGRQIANTLFPSHDPLRTSSSAWRWVRDVVTQEFECDAEDIGCDEDSDRVTVCGEPVAHFSILVDNVFQDE